VDCRGVGVAWTVKRRRVIRVRRVHLLGLLLGTGLVISVGTFVWNHAVWWFGDGRQQWRVAAAEALSGQRLSEPASQAISLMAGTAWSGGTPALFSSPEGVTYDTGGTISSMPQAVGVPYYTTATWRRLLSAAFLGAQARSETAARIAVDLGLLDVRSGHEHRAVSLWNAALRWTGGDPTVSLAASQARELLAQLALCNGDFRAAQAWIGGGGSDQSQLASGDGYDSVEGTASAVDNSHGLPFSLPSITLAEREALSRRDPKQRAVIRVTVDGRPVANAPVSLTPTPAPQTGYTVQSISGVAGGLLVGLTDAHGYAVIRGLPTGYYTVQVEVPIAMASTHVPTGFVGGAPLLVSYGRTAPLTVAFVPAPSGLRAHVMGQRFKLMWNPYPGAAYYTLIWGFSSHQSSVMWSTTGRISENRVRMTESELNRLWPTNLLYSPSQRLAADSLLGPYGGDLLIWGVAAYAGNGRQLSESTFEPVTSQVNSIELPMSSLARSIQPQVLKGRYGAVAAQLWGIVAPVYTERVRRSGDCGVKSEGDRVGANCRWRPTALQEEALVDIKRLYDVARITYLQESQAGEAVAKVGGFGSISDLKHLLDRLEGEVARLHDVGLVTVTPK